jgi:putative ABC transport system substrate-binding protein
MKLAGGLLAAVLVLTGSVDSGAQPAGKVFRLGVLSLGQPPTPEQVARRPFAAAMKELGWVEGRNLVIERRYAQGRRERLPELAAELVRLNVDVILASGPPPAAAAREVTRTVPTVMLWVTDPVGLGYAASLARPGGNMTGVAWASGPEIATKLMEVLKETVPGATRTAAIYDIAIETAPLYLPVVDAAARRLGLDHQRFGIRRPEELDDALKRLEARRPDAFFTVGDPLVWTLRKPILEFIARHRLPSAFGDRGWAHEGGLLSYGLDLDDAQRRAAAYVDRIFRGANPAELPIEQPTKYELVVNLRAARALGLTIPQSILLRADQVLE